MIDIQNIIINMCFEYLHLDVIPIIFSYLSQYELLSILFINKFIYNQILKYINTTKFILIDHEHKLRNGCKKNLIISIKQIKCNLDWNWIDDWKLMQLYETICIAISFLSLHFLILFTFSLFSLSYSPILYLAANNLYLLNHTTCIHV